MNNESKIDKLKRQKRLINEQGDCCVCRPNRGCNRRGESRSQKSKATK